MKIRTLTLSGVLAACAFAAAPAMAQEAEDTSGITVSGLAAVVSDYRFRGISQTDEDFAVQGGFTVAHDSGLYVGTWGSNVDLFASGSNAEIDVFAGYGGKINEAIGFDVGLLYYIYPGVDGNTDYFEPYASISGDIGPVNAKLGAAYAWKGQNALGDNDNIYVFTDLAAGIPGTPLKLKGHVGYSDGSLAFGGNYWDYSVGAELSYNALTFGVSYVDTDLGNFRGVDNAVVFSVGASF
jgi:uncharacterized protein (TIGR02001 family)